MNKNGLKKEFYHGQHNSRGYSIKTTAAALEMNYFIILFCKVNNKIL